MEVMVLSPISSDIMLTTDKFAFAARLALFPTDCEPKLLQRGPQWLKPTRHLPPDNGLERNSLRLGAREQLARRFVHSLRSFGRAPGPRMGLVWGHPEPSRRKVWEGLTGYAWNGCCPTACGYGAQRPVFAGVTRVRTCCVSKSDNEIIRLHGIGRESVRPILHGNSHSCLILQA